MTSVVGSSKHGLEGPDEDAEEPLTNERLQEVSAVKKPPPEKPEAIWTRTQIILSFWMVILCLGLPMWWKTTSIYRARLPFQEMLDWDHGTVGHTHPTTLRKEGKCTDQMQGLSTELPSRDPSRSTIRVLC